MSEFIKNPCSHCPYRHDVKPFLTPERGEELAYLATNPYSNRMRLSRVRCVET